MPTPSDPDCRPPRPVYVVNAASPRLQARIAALNVVATLLQGDSDTHLDTALAAAATFEAWLPREEDQ